MVGLLVIVLLVGQISANDVTPQMFGTSTDGLPAAFGDFDSDEYTDLFVIRDSRRTLEILLGGEVEPMFRSANIKCTFNNPISSVVPGDFDGDALMDVMVTLLDDYREYNNVVILWGESTRLNCSEAPVFRMRGQPLAIDYDRNMIIDLFGVDEDKRRTFWIFNKNRTTPEMIHMAHDPNYNSTLRIPHSHAFLDFNGDSLADLYITTEENFEIWYGADSVRGFVPGTIIPFPPGYSRNKNHYIGQTVFQDIELKGKLDHVVPVCFDGVCTNSTILVYSEGKWYNLKVNFHDGTSIWSFPHDTEHTQPYLETTTLRAGDFNMDGYPDVLVTLSRSGQLKSFFLENVECTSDCGGFSRTFAVRWNKLSPYNNDTVLGVFYDFLQDGILDVIFVHNKPTFNVSAFRNSLDYDSNFMKVMVVTGLTNKEHPLTVGPLGKKRRTYGTNLPGPKVSYNTTTQEGDPRAAVSTQIPQSAHFSLNLPYTIFGLGRTPNFIDSLTVGVYKESHVWSQLIPNSQMVVIPSPIDEPTRWKVQLFVTPSKLILQSVLALMGTCVIISIIIAVLYWKERREDHFEKLQEAHRFHFDAM